MQLISHLIPLFYLAALAVCLLVFWTHRRREPLVPSLMAVAIALLLIVPASADSAAPLANTLLHIPQPVWDEINALLVGLFLAVGGLAWKWIDAHSPLKKSQAEDIARDAFSTLLTNAAKFGLAQANSAETHVDGIDLKDPRIAAGANFLIAQAPSLAKKLGVDVTTPAGRAAIVRSVALRVADLSTPAGQPPQALEQPVPAEVALAGSPTEPQAAPKDPLATEG